MGRVASYRKVTGKLKGRYAPRQRNVLPCLERRT
nr:MAG TPA: hypothetical protein [Caudoviricetes sp.]